MKYVKGMLIFAVAMGVTAGSWAEEVAAKSDNDHGIRVSLGVAPGINEAEIEGDTFAIDDDTGGQIVRVVSAEISTQAVARHTN